MSQKQYKVVLLGQGRVGKTSLVLRYVNCTFTDKQQTTVQASFLSKRIAVDNDLISLAIWDTAGQERFHALGPIYYRDADGAVLVYDITEADSFARVKNWVKELRRMVGKDISLVICGNKCDLERQRSVKVDEAEAYAASVGADHFLTSAKLDKGVDESFLNLAKKIVDSKKNAPPSRSSSSRPQTIAIIPDEPHKSDRCCS